MNEQYWDGKYEQIKELFVNGSGICAPVEAILKQIATDQREADKMYVDKKLLTYIPLFRACKSGGEVAVVLIAFSASIRRDWAAIRSAGGTDEKS